MKRKGEQAANDRNGEWIAKRERERMSKRVNKRGSERATSCQRVSKPASERTIGQESGMQREGEREREQRVTSKPANESAVITRQEGVREQNECKLPYVRQREKKEAYALLSSYSIASLRVVVFFQLPSHSRVFVLTHAQHMHSTGRALIQSPATLSAVL